MNILESKEVTLNDNYYIISAMDVVDGLEFMDKMMTSEGRIPAKEMRTALMKYVKLGGKAFTEKSFGIHFSRKYDELMQLFEEFMSFNYGDFDPNAGSDTSEEEDTSEE